MKSGIGYCIERDALLSGKKVAEKSMETGDLKNPGLVLAFCGGLLHYDDFFKGLR